MISSDLLINLKLTNSADIAGQSDCWFVLRGLANQGLNFDKLADLLGSQLGEFRVEKLVIFTRKDNNLWNDTNQLS